MDPYKGQEGRLQTFSDPQGQTSLGRAVPVLDKDGFHEIRFNKKGKPVYLYKAKRINVVSKVSNDELRRVKEGNYQHLYADQNLVRPNQTQIAVYWRQLQTELNEALDEENAGRINRALQQIYAAQ